MPENRSRFVLACQQAFAFAAVATVAVSAIGVVELEIVAPSERAPLPVRPETSLVAAAPVESTVRTVALAGGTASGHSTGGPEARPGTRPKSRTEAGSAQEIRTVSAPEPVKGFATVGVTWENGPRLGEDDVQISLRTREDGTWSGWQEMHVDAAHAPDPGTPDAEGERVLREGTDAVVIGDVDDVQVRAVAVAERAPRELSLSIVDPGEERDTAEVPGTDTAAGSATGTTEAAQLTAAGRVPQPKIFTRKDWRADERLRDGSPRYGEIHAGFVHHTVNANDYSRDEVPAIIRGIYAFHTQGRGWSDVGYNFLVDRFGRIWEGRAGGIDRPVVGAHTLGYNDYAFAMSAIGNFEEVRPTQAVIDAYAALMAWKLSLHGVRADDRSQRVGSGTFQAINGHRDAGSTACPGRYLYAELADIRAGAARIQDGKGTPDGPEEPPALPEPPSPELTAPVRDADLSGSRWPDLAVRDRSTQRLHFVRTAGQLAWLPPVKGEPDWTAYDLMVPTGDLDGDGVGDLLARHGSTGVTTLHPGLGDGTFGAGTRAYDRFARFDQITGVGDFDGDGHADLVARETATHRLVLYPGRGEGAFAPMRRLAADWSGYDLTVGVDDLDGDGHPDLLAREGRRLFLVPGTGRGIGALKALPGTWGRFDVIAGRGDVTADGVPDVLVRGSGSRITYVHPGDGAGGLGPRLGPFPDYDGEQWMAIGGQLAGAEDDRDLVGLGAGGKLRVFEHTGRRNLGATVDTGVSVAGADLVLNVGDWNGDGHGDVMTRTARTGRLFFRAGLGDDRLAAPVPAGRGWDEVSGVTAVGDMTGDGDPDLMGRIDGERRVYSGDGKDGFDGSVTGGEPLAKRLAEAAKDYDWVLGVIDVDGDEVGDLVVRQRSNGRLWLLPGTSDGYGDRRLIAPGFDAYDLGG